MSIEKSEVKVGTAHELGCRLDDALESLTKDLYRLEGSLTALKHAAQSADVIYKTIDRDIDEGKIELEEASRAKKYIEKYVGVLNSSASQSENNRVVQMGKMQAMQIAVQIAKKFKDDEENKLNVLKTAYSNLKAQDVSDVKETRPAGVRPGLSIKERRLAAELQKKEEESDQKNIDNTVGIPKEETETPGNKDDLDRPKARRQKR